MNQERWTNSTSPVDLIEFVDHVSCGVDIGGSIATAFCRRTNSDRLLRLFCCACCRLAWNAFDDGMGDESIARLAVFAAEELADGHMTPRAAARYRNRAEQDMAEAGEHYGQYAARAAATCCYRNDGWMHARDVAVISQQAGGMVAGTRNWSDTSSRIARDQAHLVRDLFGDPWRDPPAVDPHWLSWNDGAVARMAGCSYRNHRFKDELPILADALEDAGCQYTSILDHLRSGLPHARGCWVLDILLGKGKP